MKKKRLHSIVGLALCLLAIGCGKENLKEEVILEEGSTKQEVTTTETGSELAESSVDVEEEGEWIVKSLEIPTIEDSTVREVEFEDTGHKLIWAKTPYSSLDSDSIKKYFNESTYFSNLYNFGKEKSEYIDCKLFIEGPLSRCNLWDNVVGVLKEKDSDNEYIFGDIDIALKSDTLDFEGINKVTFTFDEVDNENLRTFQNEITPIICAILGDDIGNYLVYGGSNPTYMEEYIKNKNTNYLLERSVRTLCLC